MTGCPLLDSEYAARQNGKRLPCERLQVENVKLRELVEDMLDCVEIRAAWHRPPTDDMCNEFAQRARELGVDA